MSRLHLTTLSAVFVCLTAASSHTTQLRADTLDGPCRIMPAGLINQRWLELDGATGPMGCPTAPEAPVAGTNARKMPFTNGEIVWSPSQGPKMVVAGYQHDDNIIVSWGDSSPHVYEMFIVRWEKNGRAGQADVDSYIEPTQGFYRIHSPTPGTYTIGVEGCNRDAFGTHCDEKWTVPVTVKYDLPPIPRYANCPVFTPSGPIGDRWARLGGGEGPLGCPVGPARPVSGSAARTQVFQHGAIAFSPDQGELMTVALYHQNGQLIADWGDTAPFSYDKFILRLDKDGHNIGQQDIGHGRSGHWSTPVGTSGAYSVVVEGCHTGVGGSDCPQKWTVPARLDVTIPPAPPPVPSDTSCGIKPVTKLIVDRWIALGAKPGRLGCPTAPEHEIRGRRGRAIPFERGEITWSPEQGEKMVVAVYQEGGQIVVNWGETLPRHYTFFIVRLDYQGQNIGQVDAVGKFAGEYRFNPIRPTEDEPAVDRGSGVYSVIVEGCDSGAAFAGVECKQKWTAPASVFYRTTASTVDLSSLPVPRTLDDALRDKPRRALLAANDIAARGLKPKWGDDETTTAIAMMYLITDAVAQGKKPTEPRRFGQRFGMLTEINNGIRGETIHANAGTSMDDIPGCHREGEYDFALKGYVALLYRYGKLLAPDVRYRLLHLLNKSGPATTDDDHINCHAPAVLVPTAKLVIPETENHVWMIESSRYLTNQLQFKRTKQARFNNATNGMDRMILALLQRHLRSDFIEYNARPYSRLTWAAIQNVYDHAENRDVKATAKAVLDYLSVKVAVSTNDGRRNPPYRRKRADYHEDLFHPQADRLKKRFLLYTAPTAVMRELTPANAIEPFATGEMVLAAATTYQPPNLVIDLMVNPAHRSFYQRFVHAGTEIYASEPDFLITAGGKPAPYAYTVLGKGKEDDVGLMMPTMLMPTGQFTAVQHMIRFEGASVGRSNGPQLCVAPGFACGFTPLIPPAYTATPGCARREGLWTFIDFASDACRDEAHREFGFYAVVFNPGKTFEMGFFEAVPKSKVKGVTLEHFARRTLERNGKRIFSMASENRYLAWGDNEIRFDLRLEHPIIATGIPTIDPLLVEAPSASLARGTIANSVGRTGVIALSSPATGETLTLKSAEFPAPTPPAPAPAPARQPAPAADALGALRARGIDFSVAEAELRDWLHNSYTPYPAISAALLTLLAERPLARPIYIDVIVWNYENLPGGSSPRAVADVIPMRLKVALVVSHNSRYGENVTDFQQLLR